MIPVEHLAMLVLASKARMDILNLLVKRPMSLKEISLFLAMERGTVRYHLKLLQEANFVGRCEIRGGRGRPEAFYHIVEGPSAQALSLAHLFEKAGLSLATTPAVG